jgi:hypothetical protein
LGTLAPSTSDRPPLSFQKRYRDLLASDMILHKKFKNDNKTSSGRAGEQEAGTSDQGEKPKELEAEEPRRPQKQPPKVQSAIYASHKISSSLEIPTRSSFNRYARTFSA